MQLFPIYPNPINQEAVVSFRLSSYENISVRIYDILGNEVSVMAQRKLSAGQHEIVWDGTDLTISSHHFFRQGSANPKNDSHKISGNYLKEGLC